MMAKSNLTRGMPRTKTFDTEVQDRYSLRKPKQPRKSLHVDGCHVAYCHHYATGEGVTTLLVAAGTPEQARSCFNRHVPEYFRNCMTVVPLAQASVDPAVAQIAAWIPQPVMDLLARNPRGTTEYYSELHFNLA